MDAAGERADPDDRGRDVRGLGVVDVEHAAERPTSSSRCSTPREPGQRRAHRVRRRRRARASTAAAAIAFSRLWAPRSRISSSAISGSPRQTRRSSATTMSAPRAASASRHRRRERPRGSPRPPSLEPGGRDRDRVRRLVGEDPQLRVAVRGERAVAVEVVGREVEQHGGVRRERDRVLELERRRLADHDGGGVERARPASSAPCRRCPRPRRGSPASRWIWPTSSRRRRLAVGAGDRDHVVGQQPPAELELAEHDDAALARRAHDRRLLRHAGALDERAARRRAARRRRSTRARRRRPPRARRSRAASTAPAVAPGRPPRRARAAPAPAARPERARPTTRNGPGGSGGRGAHRPPIQAARLDGGSRGRPSRAAGRARLIPRPRPDPAPGVRAAAVELQALGLQPPADLGRVAQRGRADRAVGLQDAVGAGRLLAHEALVERAGVAVGAAAGVRDVPVAHPAARAGWTARTVAQSIGLDDAHAPTVRPGDARSAPDCAQSARSRRRVRRSR